VSCSYTESLVFLPVVYQQHSYSDVAHVQGAVSSVQHAAEVNASSAREAPRDDPNGSRVSDCMGRGDVGDGVVVLGNLGSGYKVSHAIFSVWMALMRRFPHTVLRLLEVLPAAAAAAAAPAAAAAAVYRCCPHPHDRACTQSCVHRGVCYLSPRACFAMLMCAGCRVRAAPGARLAGATVTAGSALRSVAPPHPLLPKGVTCRQHRAVS
jgi:hypothetical protein